jgi:hypothetical protein
MNDMLSAIAPALDNPFGAVVTIFFIALAQSFRRQSDTADEANVGTWIYALEDAYAELSEHTNHRPAMVSTLETFNRFLQTLHSTGNVSKAAKAAEEGLDTDTDLGAWLLCAFFAGLTGPVHEKLVQDAAAEGEWKAGEEEPKHELGVREMEVGVKSPSDMQADVADQSFQEEYTLVENSQEPEQTAVFAGDWHLTSTDEASVSPQIPESPSKEPASRPGLMATLGATFGLTRKEGTPEEKAATAQQAPIGKSQVTEASGDATVDTLQIEQSDFNAATEAVRGRERVTLPTRQMEETTLLDMVRQPIETLSTSPKEEAVVERDADGVEYEFV